MLPMLRQACFACKSQKLRYSWLGVAGPLLLSGQCHICSWLLHRLAIWCLVGPASEFEQLKGAWLNFTGALLLATVYMAPAAQCTGMGT